VSTVRIPPVLRESVGGARSVNAEGDTVAKVLDDLFAQYPSLRDRVTEDGELSRFINVYVNDRDVRYRDGLDTTVGAGDTVILLPAMAGGAPDHSAGDAR
jgi:molybdopterin converting factor small subunit